MSLFRPIPKPKPKGILKFRQNRISAKTAEIWPKTETESVSVVPYRIDAYNTPLLIKPPVLQNSNKPPLKKFTSYNSPPS